MNVNVFSSLFKYSGADENYLTEVLVFIMRLLLERDPVQGLSLVDLLTHRNHGPCFADPGSVIISTQVAGEKGRPDIEIRDGADALVYVEVKHDSALGVDQLERYQAQLLVSGVSETGLTLLTRSRHASLGTILPADDYHHLCWYEIYNRMARLDTPDKVIKYLMNSFMGFLEEKKMSMKQVTWEYIQGVPAMLKLTDMLEAAIAKVLPGVKFKRTPGWSWRGFYLHDDLWWGVRYEEPLLVVFENNQGNVPVTYKRDLDLQGEHFFSLTKDQQFECLVAFLQDAAGGASLPQGTEQV